MVLYKLKKYLSGAIIFVKIMLMSPSAAKVAQREGERSWFAGSSRLFI